MNRNERAVLDLIHRRYDKVVGNGRRYAVAEHVRSSTGWATRCADAVVMDLWESSGLPFHGFEVKVSRADWRTELAHPEKADAFRPYMHYWWLAVPDAAIVREDLPDGWGLMVQAGSTLRVRRPAPRLDPEPMPRPMLAAMMRAVAKTAERRVLRSRTGQRESELLGVTA